MKDSRIGSYGAVGLILILAAKLAALTALPPGDAVRGLVAAHLLGRWSSIPLIWRYPYARLEEGGTGKPFAASVTLTRLTVGTLIAVAMVAGVLGIRTPQVLVVAVVITALAGHYFHRQIGGITGDCLGAANQLVEVATYLALSFTLH
jgi:adenosylcobinamide-GDP ribazoletransferase